MRIYLLLLFNLSFICAARSQSLVWKRDKLILSAYADFKNENLQWSIAGNSNGQNPNILSEVSWKNLKTRGAGLDIQANIWSGLSFKGKYQHGYIYAGNATDTDYAQDNKTNPTYHASLNSNQGDINSYFAGLSYLLIIYHRLSFSPYAGYTKNKQSLLLKSNDNSSQINEKKLNSTYTTNWTGTEIGLDADMAVNNWINFKVGLSYAQVRYAASADWNLIDAFAHPLSFSHRANGYQTNLNLQTAFQVLPQFSVFIRGNYLHRETGTGTDQLFLADGQNVISQFNGAKGNSKGIGLGICYKLK